MTANRESPVSSALYRETPPFTIVNGMPVAVALDQDSTDVPVGLADASSLLRLGVKGPKAAHWLEACGVMLPAGVNSYHRNGSGELVARLGRAEFFLEDQLAGTRIQQLSGELLAASGVYPVPRQDAAFVLHGARSERVLAQTTNFDFRKLCREANHAVLTHMAGVSVLVLGYEAAGTPRYRIWCDPSFGAYLCKTLLGIVREEGGRATGLLAALGQAAEPAAAPAAAQFERNQS